MYATPTGTRDVLHDELRELRQITDALRAAYEARGYGEVRTPAIEHDDVLRRGAGDVTPGYRVVDDHGNVLALRPDMTVPIARLGATRFADVDPPLRFSYLAHVYRSVRPHRGESRELQQSGIELLGAAAPGGTAEVLTVLADALGAAGLRDHQIALGSAAVFPRMLDALGAEDAAKSAVLDALAAGDFVRLRALAREHGLGDDLLRISRLRGGPDVLDAVPGDAAGGLRGVLAALDGAVRDRIVVDLGLVRGFGYYTGAVFDVLHPALGAPLGGGGRYDDLVGRFGRDLPAVGFALEVDQLHAALMAEESA